jgi:SNF2 family DNA or RNA helicase
MNEREHQKHLMVQEILNYDIVVTTYEMIKNPQLLSLMRGTYWNLCVLDEGHVIKSQTTLVSEAARKIHCQTRVILTGTPLQNNLVSVVYILI